MLGLRCNGPRAAELAATFGLDIAAYNSPSSTTVSGETKAIEALELSCLGLGISTRRLHVSRAFHSRQMNGICTPLRQELEGIEFADATVPILRGLDGQVDADGVMSRREYWIEQSLQAVNFEQGLRTLRGQSVTSFVEIGPQPALVGLAREVVGDAQALYLASQRRQETSPVTLLGSVAQLYVAGANPSWKHLEPAWQTTRVPFPLPSKPRVYREYRPRVAHATARAGARIPEGVAAWPGIVYFGPGERWTSRLRISARAADSFWADHRIFGETVVPGAAHLAWVIGGAIGQNWPKVVVSDVEFVRPLFLRSSDTELQCLVELGLQGQYRVVVASRASNSNRYVEHMRATLTREAHSEATEPTAVAPVSGEWQVESGAEFYKLRIPSALALGASFRWVDRVQRQGLRAFAVLIAPQGLSAEWLQPGPFPGLIDSCFQTCMATFDAQKGDVWVPVGIHRVDWIAASDCHEVNVLVQRSAQSAQGMEEVSADVEVYDSGRRLVARFVGLRARRLREEHMQSGPGLNYVRTWQAALVPPSKSCRVMLLGGSRALRDALLAQSDAHLFLTDGGALPTDPHAFDDHLSRQVALAEQSDCGLAYLEEAESPDMTSMSWQHDAARAARLIMFAKELKRQRWQDRAVFLFSRCVTQISAEAELLLGTPSGAFTWGVGPCISRVLRNAPVRVVDVSAQPVVLLAQELSLALRAADDELVAVRAQRLYRARLQRQAPREQNPEAGHAAREGAWLVTGGLSGLGFETAKWLAQRGAAELVLMGRRSPSEEIATELATLKAGGTCVWVASGDVSELSDLQRIFDKYPRIRNIVHAAGELADRPLEEVTERDVQTCFRAKVGGALNLEQVSRSHNVERLIMFASAAGWIGSAGQIAYAAANAKLEDIAVARNRRGQATFIVAFGPFDGTGMASRLAAPLRQRQEAAGVSFHSVERGLESLSLALGDTPTSFMALDVNWGNFVQSLVNAQATVPSWVPQDASGPERKAPSKDRSTGALKDQLRQLPASLRLDSLMSTLREQIARVLQLDPQRLELGVGLFEVGLDSLMAVEIRDSLEQQLAAELEPTLLIDNSSLRLLAARLLTVCGLDDVVIGEAERDAPISHIATDVHRLSDDQVDGLLEELLGAE